jgi:phage/plasmid-associated DNA primase
MLADRIVENELPGVLRWAVEGLVMLLKAGGFKDIPESVHASKKQMQLETDNVLGWWTDKDVQVCDAPRTSKDSAYRSYSLWCKDNGMMPLGSPRFWVRVKSLVNKLGLELVEKHAQETISDPFSGSSQVVRTRKLNLDITSGQQDMGGEGTTVVPLAPKAKGFGVTNMKQPKPAVQPLSDMVYDELDPGEDFDLASIPF